MTYWRAWFLRGALALGVATLLLAGSIGARAADNQITLSILGIGGWTPSELSLQMAPDFERYARQHDHLNIKITEDNAPFTNLYQKAAASLAARSSQYDIIISDSQWLGAFATPRWIVRLNDLIDNDPDLREIQQSWVAPIVKWSYQTYPYKSENLYGLPQEGDVLVLYVRKDLVDNPQNQADFKARYGWPLPTTFTEWAHLRWSQFEQICAFFNRPPKMYGLAMEYAKTYDFMSDHVMSMMWMWGGQIWDSKTHQVYGILNSPENDAALRYYVHMLKYQPPGADTYGITEDIDAFTQGRVFAALTWSAVGPAMFTPAMQGKIMVVPPPGHMLNGKFMQIYCIGGQPWVVNRFLDKAHREAAFDFLKWWYLPATQQKFAELGGNPVTRQVVDAKGFDAIHPWYRAYRYMLTDEHQRDFWHNPTYAALLNAQQEAWTAYATGVIKSARQANEFAACRQQEILYEAGYTQNQAPPSCKNAHL